MKDWLKRIIRRRQNGRSFSDPVIQFEKGEQVPNWIFQVEPPEYQEALTFAANARATIGRSEVCLRFADPPSGEESALIKFYPGIAREWLDFEIVGAPTVIDTHWPPK